MKKVTWGEPKITAAQAPGTYRTYKEMIQKAAAVEAEQQQATAYLQKAMPAMLALLNYKLQNNQPLIVMRPLRYQTSEMNSPEEDDGFYKSSSNSADPKFKDTIKVIMPGTQLMLKSLDMAMNEFIFQDAQGREHALNFCERNNLLTQTSIFEEVKNYIENQGV
jgi:hypothetical protein